MSALYDIQTTGDQDYPEYIKALICGNPGVGKTKFSATSPKPFMLSAEGGLMSIHEDKVPYITIEKLGGIEGVKTLISTLQQKKEIREEQLGIEVKTFIIDTIDEVARLMMKEHLKSEGVSNARIQDYGWLKDTMTSFVRAVRNLDMHVIMTAHLKSVTDDSDTQKYLPAIDGSFAEAIAGYVDLAFVLRNDLTTEVVNGQAVRTVNRWLQTYPEPKYDWIKDRSGRLPQQVAVEFNGDFTRIADVVFGNKNSDSAAREFEALPVQLDTITTPEKENV